ncbi:MAG: c-type cytochrome [Gemmatimonadaceae bacterium]|nr:c-type cytochrome [Gemmatimonadaceae bacterium]
MPSPRAYAAADTALPTGAMGDAVRRGRTLLAATRDSLPSHVGSSLRCFSCHLDEGRRASGLPLVGAYVHYPQFRSRGARVDLIEDRVNDCFLRSLNGRTIAADGADMRDIVTYLAWLSRGVAAVDSARSPAGASAIATLDADTARGKQIFSENCVRCHGASGHGTVVAPPLWGPKSYNIGAGMARYRTAAQFVLHNMPFDRPNSLTPQQALDVARYIDTRPRPDYARKEYDWPMGSPPSDVPYSTRARSTSGANTARTHAHNGAR